MLQSPPVRRALSSRLKLRHLTRYGFSEQMRIFLPKLIFTFPDKKKVVITEATIRDVLRLDDAEGVVEGDDDEVHDEGVSVVGVAIEGVVSAAEDVVPTDDEEPSIPSPTPPSPPPQPSQDVAQALEITKLNSRVKKLERRNKASKLKRLKKVGSAQRNNTSDDTMMDDVSNQNRMIADMDADVDVVLEDATDVAADIAKDCQVTDVKDNADIQGRTAESQAQIYQIDLEHANKMLSMQEEEESEPAELHEVVDVVTTAKIITENVTAAGTTITAADVPIPAATTVVAPILTAAPSRRRKSQRTHKLIADIDTDVDVVLEDAKDVAVDIAKDLDVVTTAKIIIEVVTTAGTTITVADVPIPAATIVVAPILTAAPSRRRKGTKPLKKQAQIEQDEKYDRGLEVELNKNIDWDEVIDHVQRKQKEDKVVKRYQALKRKPQTEAQAKKNMMLYLKNVAGFKMDYFKGMSYDDIRLIFEKHFNFNLNFLLKSKEQINEEENGAPKRLNKSKEEKAAKKKKLDEEVEELKRHLQIVRNDDDDRGLKIVLWSLVKERFATAKPKNFSDEFLLITLGAMFEKPNIHAQIWKNQRIDFAGKRRYPLTKFTLNQMLNNVRLEVKEESEVYLDLLRPGSELLGLSPDIRDRIAYN
nr:hypothetical protein [Tanacetum cinerariifolium]